jgi:hypothetical protein
MLTFHELFHHMHHENNTIINTAENQAKLYAALTKAISETKDIVADSTNPFHKSKYASLSAHLKVLKPIFAKHELAIIQLPFGSHEAIGIRTIVIHSSGASLETDATLPADKGMTGQQAGAIYSYLRRYALAGVAGVATDDDDAESDRTARPASQAPVTLGTTKTSKFIPNPSVGKSSGTAVAPFGDAKGTPLADLPRQSDDRSKKCADLNYWANVWEPRPFGDTGKISPKDIATKAEAQRLWSTESEAPAQETSDEVPF